LQVFLWYAPTYPVAAKAHVITQNLFSRIDPGGWLGFPTHSQDTSTLTEQREDVNLFSVSWDQMNWEFMKETPDDQFMFLDVFDDMFGGSPTNPIVRLGPTNN
jgi:hypothetical protein